MMSCKLLLTNDEYNAGSNDGSDGTYKKHRSNTWVNSLLELNEQSQRSVQITERYTRKVMVQLTIIIISWYYWLIMN